MIPRTAALALILAATASAAEDLPEHVFAPLPEDEVQDVLFFDEARPVFLRFRIRVGGDGFRVAWANFNARFHRFLDANGDGVLTTQEAKPENWQQFFQNVPRPRRPDPTAGAGPAVLDPDKDGRVSVDELANYLRASMNLGAFGLRPGPAPDPRAQAVFGLLDLDRDGKLSPDELAATDACVARHDLDEDELIGLDEMKPFENPYARQFRVVNDPAPPDPESDNSPIVALGPATAHPGLARRLLGRYDRAPKDGRLAAAELGGDPEVVHRFDADGNGGLDDNELTSLLRRPPADLEFNVALGAAGKGDSTIRPSETPRPTLPISDALRLEREGVTVEFAIEDHINNNFRDSVIQRFNIFDGDKDGYLDKKEVERRPLFQQIFPLADRDGDGKLSRKELESYLDRQADAVASRTLLTLGDDGRALLEILDDDGDRRLGLRELRRARGRLSSADRDGDGRVAQGEIPRRYRLVIGRGQALPNRGIAMGSYDTPDPPNRKGGPPWFEKMDRNRDGDVSPREFLGTRADFRRLDADGDGLIDPREATGKP